MSDGLKYILASLALLGLLGAALWLGMVPSQAPQSMPVIPRIDVAAVSTITIEATGMRVHLRKAEDQWLVDGSRADNELVERLLADLSGMQPVRLLTRNPQRYGELGLAEDSVHLTLQDSAEKIVAELYVGKQGTDILSTYIRFSDMDAAIAVDRTLVWQVRRSQQGWYAPEIPESDSDIAS